MLDKQIKYRILSETEGRPVAALDNKAQKGEKGDKNQWHV
jgi:hypothetical protein